jgi:hypothetical protein
MIPWLQMIDCCADLLDDSDTLVAEHHRKGNWDELVRMS